MLNDIDGNRIPKFRLIFVGNKKVGKTSGISQFVNSNYFDDYYPTTYLTIYRKGYNFNQGENETDELVYIELLDTMGYNFSKTGKDYNEFSKRIGIEERDISSTADYNIKKHNSVLLNIHHEYFPSKEKESNMVLNLGLFSKSDIMAYVFVFDYKDNNSGDEILEGYTKINNDDESKGGNEGMRTVKCFICNKYIYQPEYKGINDYPSTVQYGMDKDDRTREIVNKIGQIVERKAKANKIGDDFVNENDKFILTKKRIYFTNAQLNKSVRKALDGIIGEIQQKDGLWKGKAYTKEEQDNDFGKQEQGGGFSNIGGMAMCGKRDNLEDDEENKNNDRDDSDLNYDKQDSSDDEIDNVKKFVNDDEKSDDKDKEKEEEVKKECGGW